MKKFRLSLLLALVVCIGAGSFLFVTTGEAREPQKAQPNGKKEDDQNPHRKEYRAKVLEDWGFIDWCFAGVDGVLSDEEAVTMQAI